MKENVFVFHDKLQRGLRPERAAHNQFFLLNAENLRATPYGLSRPDILTLPEDWIIEATDFPDTRLFKGMIYTLLCKGTSLYQIESDQTATELATVDLADASAEKDITAGTHWDFIDFGKSFLLINGNCNILKLESKDDIYVDDSVSLNTGCAFRGRWMVAGLSSSHWQSGMHGYLQRQAAKAGVEVPSQYWGGNFVRWGMIGGGDLLSLFKQDLTIIGDEDSLVWDEMERGDAGFMPIPYQGDILRIAPLNDRVIVYSESGVVVLTPVEHFFGLVDLQIPGLLRPAAIGTGRGMHIFIDQRNDLWRISGGEAPQRLGYREWLSAMTTAKVCIFPHPQRDEFYITDGTTSYLLTPTGLTEEKQIPAGVVAEENSLNAAAVLDETEDAVQEFALESDVVDFGNRGIKTIHSLEVAAHGATELEGAIKYRIQTSDAFAQTDWADLNGQDFVVFDIAGIEYKILLRGTWGDNAPHDCIIDYGAVRWRQHDKRNRRGWYQAEPAQEP